MRKTTVRLASTCALAAGLALGVQSAAHAGGYEFMGSFPSQSQCVSAGEQGLADQSWSDYHCTSFEGAWDLYARTS